MIALAGLARGARKFAIDNAPAILTGVACAGVATTAVLAVKATKPALIDIMHAESELGRDLTKTETVKLCWKYYVPAAGVGVMTIACIVTASSINTTRQAAMASAYAMTEQEFRKFQEKMAEQHGQNKTNKVQDDVNQDIVRENPPSQEKVVIVSSGNDHLFMDKLSGRYFRTTVDKVDKAINRINFDLNNNAYASLNDFYEYLELDHTEMGEELGWKADDILEIRRSLVMAGDEPCIVLGFSMTPIRNYWKFGG
ncbi:hypothetical protein SEA_SLOOPYJOE_38 [Arthrobacter phage Sloopyjoe]|nr:hypothetical protein PBI_STAYER_38 [Arthrobacter phage Stayer]QFG09746.1 hypothetical protein PBI_SHIBA_37 [Arthrobacter phage Shiba]QFG11752.1 hypothetical protein PBI_SALK_38 [Arthrobacter phage Salk]QFG12635.1 hypothetical protein PBI_MICHELLE_38 [Arthrobacter phage Michelle]QFG14408.1 hypothetical protein PBI_STARLORD_38 [Arthrobacter phage StarLord]UVT31116.1 hypothetical protein PBI_LINDA_38 [Arthrobacter phage Linda]WAB09454.1 hypothetical protein SEA_SLOOPYJOE_38 [Arthrobacter phag